MTWQSVKAENYKEKEYLFYRLINILYSINLKINLL